MFYFSAVLEYHQSTSCVIIQFGTISKDGESTEIVIKILPEDLISVPWRVDGKFTFYVREFKGFVMSVDVLSEVVELVNFESVSKGDGRGGILRASEETVL
ncbi:hypothetical protein CDAR_52401 [Caerostris darwini]|uniref:Uncharacterized protein n=1 Tax=Caerostris darwini TaxID=1538125 RepID=A0AAV4S4H1_9ARAC|nr:hypothetical protein CDAR_52401 [Caerostris darwini]